MARAPGRWPLGGVRDRGPGGRRPAPGPGRPPALVGRRNASWPAGGRPAGLGRQGGQDHHRAGRPCQSSQSPVRRAGTTLASQPCFGQRAPARPCRAPAHRLAGARPSAPGAGTPGLAGLARMPGQAVCRLCQHCQEAVSSASARYYLCTIALWPGLAACRIGAAAPAAGRQAITGLANCFQPAAAYLQLFAIQLQPFIVCSPVLPVDCRIACQICQSSPIYCELFEFVYSRIDLFAVCDLFICFIAKR